MRMFLGGFATLALMAAAPAVAQEPIELNSTDDFSIAPAKLPAGCKLSLTFDSKRNYSPIAKFTCATQESFDKGILVDPSKLAKECVQGDSQVVCTVKKS